MDARSECDSDELLRTKLACLEAANTADKPADAIVRDAQKFWDFICKDDDTSND